MPFSKEFLILMSLQIADVVGSSGALQTPPAARQAPPVQTSSQQPNLMNNVFSAVSSLLQQNTSSVIRLFC